MKRGEDLVIPKLIHVIRDHDKSNLITLIIYKNVYINFKLHMNKKLCSSKKKLKYNRMFPFFRK